MVWNPSPKVAMARDIGQRLRKDQVIILMIDEDERTLESVTYGRTKRLCDQAKKLGDIAYEAVIDAVRGPQIGRKIQE